MNGAACSTMSRNDRARMRRRTIGYVFQDFNLLAGLTAVENVALPLELDGVGIKAARAAGLEALEQLGVAELADRFPDELSGGERQRVAIARAVVGDRRLLLADEPTGALDSINGEAVMRLLRAACKNGVAGVVVTHDAQLASWADRVVFLRDGHVVDQTAPPPGPESLLEPSPRTLMSSRTAGAGRRTGECRPGARSRAGRGGCSGGSGANRSLVLALLTVAIAAVIFGADRGLQHDSVEQRRLRDRRRSRPAHGLRSRHVAQRHRRTHQDVRDRRRDRARECPRARFGRHGRGSPARPARAVRRGDARDHAKVGIRTVPEKSRSPIASPSCSTRVLGTPSISAACGEPSSASSRTRPT